MVIEIKKWGNSLGLRIPRDIARTMGLEEGSEVSLELNGNQLVIRPNTEVVIEPPEKPLQVGLHPPIKGKPGKKTVQEIIRQIRDEG